MIAGAELSDFYKQRDSFTPRPEGADENQLAWYDRADWIESFSQRLENGDLQVPLLVSGMTCAACTWLIEEFLTELSEVRKVDVQLTLSRVTIQLNADATPGNAVRVLQKLGYDVKPWRNDERLNQIREHNRRDLRRLGVAGIGMMQVGMFAIALHAGDLQGMADNIQTLLRAVSTPLTLFVLFYSGRTFFSTAWHHLRQGALVMDSSVALALALATIASLYATVTGTGETYYDSITMFIFFLLLARYVEARLRNSDLLSLIRLEDGLPEFVPVKTPLGWESMLRTSVDRGVTIRINVGDAIPLDGLVIDGESQVDEAVFTGEAIPRAVTPGSSVYAGTINQDDVLLVQVTEPAVTSRLSNLQRQVEIARSEKPAHLRLVDKIAARFVTGVVLASAVTFGIWLVVDPSRALWTALSVLVIACPCALSLATPAALASATARLRRLGISVRGEYGILSMANVDTALWDKTGTLTKPFAGIVSIQHATGITEAEVLALTSALQQYSTHPAALAFRTIAPDLTVTEIKVRQGAGIEGRFGHKAIRLGSASFCAQIAPCPSEPAHNHYWFALVTEGEWLAWIGLDESLRGEVPDVLAQLKALGIASTIVSGDQSVRVDDFARQLGVDAVANTTPQGKLDYLRQLQNAGHTVLAVGDGLNDTPLLSAADASIAVAGATAIAKAEADFAVSDDNLHAVDAIVDISKRTRGIIKQNLAWAIGYNLVGIPFAAMGYVPPWAAAIGMSVSSLLVVANSLRIRRTRIAHYG